LTTSAPPTKATIEKSVKPQNQEIAKAEIKTPTTKLVKEPIKSQSKKTSQNSANKLVKTEGAKEVNNEAKRQVKEPTKQASKPKYTNNKNTQNKLISGLQALTRKKEKTNLSSGNPKSSKTKQMLARITVYWAKGSGTDRWSAQKQSATGEQLKSKEHAAVDPTVIPYGSKVVLKNNKENMIVKAVDTGSAVKSRKAAIAMAKTADQRKAPVIDIFFENKNEALRFAANNPPYQLVNISASN
jgi:3D (Asp-Asp-Asp) domain-containing protein